MEDMMQELLEHCWRLCTHIDQRFRALEQRIGVDEMSAQEQANADVTALAQVATDLSASTTSIQTELDKLQAQINTGAAVDLGPLTNAVNQLDAPVKAIGALTPTPPAEKPPVEEKPAETPPAEKPAETPPAEAPPVAPPAPPAEGA